MCNKYSVNWSGSEDSSHVIPCLCALFFGEKFMEEYFNICIEEAKKSLVHDDVPIGAILVQDGNIIAKGHNTRELSSNILGHAEINAIIAASNNLNRWNLSDCDLYVTLEPCSMCKSVIKQSRISKVYYILSKSEVKNEYNKTVFEKIDTNFLRKHEQMYSLILSDFFKSKR